MTESLSNVFVPSSIDRSVVRFVGPHRGGFVSYKRLFGGQTAAQIFKVGKLLNRGNVVHTVKAHYVAPGSVTDPIDYHVTEILGTNFMIINGTQNGKHIVSGKVMFGAKEDLLELPAHRFPDVLSPFSIRPCPSIYTLIRTPLLGR
ncbi:hypothetical protein L596_016372 [Steinernema carpocapsae]|uniref:Uncharacterized protein n=1 Tax=Steinernema carpocapsae TaxID=34508 RepID=A0A4U5NIE3_STECR|nr:hypothetical protein L596_016372 [Steinernema carpocapsae]